MQVITGFWMLPPVYSTAEGLQARKKCLNTVVHCIESIQK